MKYGSFYPISAIIFWIVVYAFFWPEEFVHWVGILKGVL